MLRVGRSGCNLVADSRLLAKRIANVGANPPTMVRHLGTIETVNSDGTVNLKLDGSSLTLTNVRKLAAVVVLTGDTVEVIVDDTDMFVLGRIATQAHNSFIAPFWVQRLDRNGHGWAFTADASVHAIVPLGGGDPPIERWDDRLEFTVWEFGGDTWRFYAPVKGPTPTLDEHLTTKAYVDKGSYKELADNSVSVTDTPAAYPFGYSFMNVYNVTGWPDGNGLLETIKSGADWTKQTFMSMTNDPPSTWVRRWKVSPKVWSSWRAY